MDKQPRGGFDSHEVSEGLFNTNDSPIEPSILKEDSVEMSQLVKKMANEYGKKLIELSIKINDLFSTINETEDKVKIDNLKKELVSLEKDWGNLHSHINHLRNHAYGEDRKEFLN